MHIRRTWLCLLCRWLTRLSECVDFRFRSLNALLPFSLTHSRVRLTYLCRYCIQYILLALLFARYIWVRQTAATTHTSTEFIWVKLPEEINRHATEPYKHTNTQHRIGVCDDVVVIVIWLLLSLLCVVVIVRGLRWSCAKCTGYGIELTDRLSCLLHRRRITLIRCWPFRTFCAIPPRMLHAICAVLWA